MWLSSGSSHPLFTTYALQGAVPRRTLDGFGKRLGVVSFGVLGGDLSWFSGDLDAPACIAFNRVLATKLGEVSSGGPSNGVRFAR
jgi:hypothetical protein